jgi:cellulose biosynthesis protein BcsQ
VIIALMADKGGVGKTTAAHNLGAELSRHGPVLLIDADKQADLTELCGVSSEPNIGMDAILRQVPTPSMTPYIREPSPGLSLLGTHPQMRKRCATWLATTATSSSTSATLKWSSST